MVQSLRSHALCTASYQVGAPLAHCLPNSFLFRSTDIKQFPRTYGLATRGRYTTNHCSEIIVGQGRNMCIISEPANTTNDATILLSKRPPPEQPACPPSIHASCTDNSNGQTEMPQSIINSIQIQSCYLGNSPATRLVIATVSDKHAPQNGFLPTPAHQS